MGRLKKKPEDKKQSISIALKPEILDYYRKLHVNLSSDNIRVTKILLADRT